ncbi:MAG: hypothetical protein ACO307_00910 [Ilumatobacteraceae bacterium]
MVDRLLIAVAIMGVAAATARVLGSRRSADPPTQARRVLPTQLDRSDFVGTDWIVVVFTSETCSTCADVVRKAEVLRSAEVAVEIVSFQSRRALHERYAIDSVPGLVVADADGVVHRSFVGPISATDLWAAVAEARFPGSVERGEGCDGGA